MVSNSFPLVSFSSALAMVSYASFTGLYSLPETFRKTKRHVSMMHGMKISMKMNGEIIVVLWP